MGVRDGVTPAQPKRLWACRDVRPSLGHSNHPCDPTVTAGGDVGLGGSPTSGSGPPAGATHMGDSMNPHNCPMRSLQFLPHYMNEQTKAGSPITCLGPRRRKWESRVLNLGLTAKACICQPSIPTSFHLLAGTGGHRV